VLLSAHNLTNMPWVEREHRVRLEVELFSSYGGPGIGGFGPVEEVLTFIVDVIVGASFGFGNLGDELGRVLAHAVIIFVDLRSEPLVLKVAVVVVRTGALVLGKAN